MLHVPDLVFGILLKRKQKSERLQNLPIQGQIHVSNRLARNTITVVETGICASFNAVMTITEGSFSGWDAPVR